MWSFTPNLSDRITVFQGPAKQTARFWNKGPLMQNNLFMRKIKRPYQKNLFLYCMKKYFKIGLWTVLTL